MRAKLSTKGQLVIPLEIRRRLGWGPGTELEVRERDGEVLVQRPVGSGETTLRELVGCAGYTGPPRSLSEMEDAIERGTRG